MHIEVKLDKPESVKTDVLAVLLWQGTSLPPRSAVAQLDTHIGGLLKDYVKSGDFSGALTSTALLRTRGAIAAPRVLLVGLGKQADFKLDCLRQASAVIATTARKLGAKSVATMTPSVDLQDTVSGQALTEGALLGLYTLKKHKTVISDDDKKDRLEALYFLAANGTAQQELDKGVERGQIIANAVTLTRNLGNSPGNEVNPSYLAETAQMIAKETGLGCQVLQQEDMRALKMGCLLGVAQGSAQPPAFIILEHAPNGAKEKPIVLVGKGITFDSGGISIKPAANMEDMKMDMSGGATVLSTMQALAQLKYPRRVIGLVPASENLPSGTAIKPGDILRAMSGKTVEVINTDAEGRLVLADALSYAVAKLEPLCIIDLATLTGAVVVALGHHATGIMGTDEDMMQRLQEAGERSSERVWPLPLFEEYSKQIKSDFADIKNTGGREAGAITGGAFLKEFVSDTPWVHLDIAGTAWTRENKPYIPKGATGVGVRLLIETLESMPKPAAKVTTKAKLTAKTKAR